MPEPLHQIWSNVLQAQEVTGWITQMYMAHKGWIILGYEIGWLLLVWLLLPWRLSKSSSWPGRLWTQVWMGAVYWGVALYFLPASQWGDPYRSLISYSLKSAFKLLLA